MSALQLVPAYVQAAALIIAGGWAYWRFFHQRSDEPATDIDVGVRFVGTQGDQHVVEVTATLENKSFVRHRYRDFRMNLRYLSIGDELEDGDAALSHQLVFPHAIDDRLEGDRHRFFPRAEYINPRQRFHHRYVTFLSGDATFVRVHCGFEFDVHKTRVLRPIQNGKSDTVKVDSQKVFRVPVARPCAGANGAGDPEDTPRDFAIDSAEHEGPIETTCCRAQRAYRP